jgi:hypothetical protein
MPMFRLKTFTKGRNEFSQWLFFVIAQRIFMSHLCIIKRKTFIIE